MLIRFSSRFFYFYIKIVLKANISKEDLYHYCYSKTSNLKDLQEPYLSPNDEEEVSKRNAILKKMIKAAFIL